MSLFWAVFLLGQLGQHPAFATDPQTEIAAKIRAEAEDFLTAILGPGRAKVVVSVEGDQTQSNTQNETLVPITTDNTPPPELPGYAPDLVIASQKVDRFNTNKQDFSISGFAIKRVVLSVVLDKSIAQSRVTSIKNLLIDLLHLKIARGDEINVIQASLLPPWRTALESQEGLRELFLIGGAGIIVVLLGIFAYWAASRLIRSFAIEVTGRMVAGMTHSGPSKGSNPIAAQLQGGLAGGQDGLLPGETPGLLEDESGQGTKALGQRFDFLTQKKPDELARILATEAPEDIAYLCAYLASSNANLAGAIFSSLPGPLQTAVSRMLATIQMADPEKLAMLETRLKTAVEYSIQGSERLGRILSHLPPDQRESVIGDLANASPESADEVQKSMFSFEDIVRLSPPDLRRLIMSVQYEDWGAALKGSTEEVAQAVLSQLLPGTRALVLEAVELPHGRQKVMESRSKVVSQAYAMAARGQISLNPEEAEAA